MTQEQDHADDSSDLSDSTMESSTHNPQTTNTETGSDTSLDSQPSTSYQKQPPDPGTSREKRPPINLSEFTIPKGEFTIPKKIILNTSDSLYETATNSSQAADIPPDCSPSNAAALFMRQVMDSFRKVSPFLSPATGSRKSSPTYQPHRDVPVLNSNFQQTYPNHVHSKFCPADCPFSPDSHTNSHSTQTLWNPDSGVGVNDFLSEADLMGGTPHSTDFDFNPQFDFQSSVSMTRQFCPPYSGPTFEGIDCDKSPAMFLREYVNYTTGQGIHPSLVFKKDMLAALKEDALNWWHFSGQYQNWEQFCSLFVSIFNSPQKDAVIEEEIRGRFQYDGENMYRYMNALEIMFSSLSYVTPENLKLKRILFNMHPRYKRQLQGCRFTSVNELAQFSVVAERKLQSEMQWRPPRPNHNWSNPKFGFQNNAYTPRAQARPSQPQPPPPSRPSPANPQQSHFNPPPNFRAPNYSPDASWRTNERPSNGDSCFTQRSQNNQGCFKCGDPGHFSRECPQRQSAPPFPKKTSPNETVYGARRPDANQVNISARVITPSQNNPATPDSHSSNNTQTKSVQYLSFMSDPDPQNSLQGVNDPSHSGFLGVLDEDNKTEQEMFWKLPEPLIKVEIEGRMFSGMLDSGACSSIANRSVFKHAEERGVSINNARRCFGLVQGGVESTKNMSVNVKFLGNLNGFQQTFYKLDNMPQDLVLGRDFLYKAQIQVSIFDGGYTCGRSEFNCFPFASIPRIFALNSEPEWLPEVMKNSDVPFSHQEELRELLIKFDEQGLFSKLPGLLAGAAHYIDTGSNTPVRCAARPVNPHKQKALNRAIDELLAADVIEPCRDVCSWGSPIVMVKKPPKPGDTEPSWRICGDYRVLNERTVFKNSTVQKISDIFNQLSGAAIFSVVDLSQSYHNIPVHPADKHKTCLRTGIRGDFVYKKLPYGLCGASQTFIMAVEHCLAGLLFKNVVAYVDDIVIYSQTKESHIRDLQIVFQRLKQQGLHINFKKMQIFTKKIELLGHEVTSNSVSPSPSKIQALKSYKTPKNKKDIQRLLGAFNYYRAFYPAMSSITAPLSKLLKNESLFQWTPIEQGAFDQLLNTVQEHTMLSLPDWNHPFLIKCDASGVALGACLLNGPRGQMKPIAYISRTLNELEQKYCSTELEVLCILWSVTKFQAYIEYAEYEIESDCISAKYITTMDNPSGRLQRWALRISSLKCKIVHRPGSTHIVPDALSRAATEPDNTDYRGFLDSIFPIADTQDTDSVQIEEVDDSLAHHKCCRCHQPTREAQANEIASAKKAKRKKPTCEPGEGDTINVVLDQPTQIPSQAEDWITLQQDDSQLARILERINSKPDKKDKKFSFGENGILLYEEQSIVVPQNIRLLIVHEMHDHRLSAHLGCRKTLVRIKEYYFWPKMNNDVIQYCLSCHQCQVAKSLTRGPVGLMNSVPAKCPGQALSVDLVGPLVKSRNNYLYVFTVLDEFSRYITVYPLKNATAVACTNALVHYCTTFGTPLFCRSDNGVQFCSQLWKNVCQALDIKHRKITPYRPCGNPVERTHKTLKACLITLIREHAEWDQYLLGVTYSLRTAINETTGFRPDVLMFGRKINLPFVPLQPPESTIEYTDQNYAAYAKEVVEKLQIGTEIAQRNIQEARTRQAKYYNEGRKSHTFETGDWVLKRNHVLSNASKGITSSLATKFLGPYVLGKQIGENVFILEQINGKDMGPINVDNIKKYHLRPDWLISDLETNLPGEESDDSEGSVFSPSEESESENEQLPAVTLEENIIDFDEITPHSHNVPIPMTLRNRQSIEKPLRYR